MNYSEPKKICAGLIGLSVLLLTACGGGSSDSSSDQVAQAPAAPPPAEVSGIEGGGSVRQVRSSENILTVGSKRLDVSASDLMVTVDGQAATLDQVRVGDQIFYAGTLGDDGVTVQVSSINQDDLVEGPIDAGSIDLAAGTFQVLGQVVLVDVLTTFSSAISPNDLTGLTAGDFVEVSGVLTEAGQIKATRIELDSASTEFEVTGVIDSIDTAAMTFVLGNLLVDYSSAELDGFGNEDPAVGIRVEVEGTDFDGTTLVATEVEREDDELDGEDGDQASLEGLVTGVLSSEEFAVNGQTVITNASTEFEGGVAADIVVGLRLEVEGSFDAAGALVASEVDFEDADEEDTSRIEIEGLVDAVDVDQRTISVLGVTIQVDDRTRLEGDDDMGLELADLVVGSVIEARGSAATDGSGALQAAKLELEDDNEDGESKITGPASQIADPMLTVFGVPVLTDGSTEFEEAQDGAAFFQQLTEGDFVEAEGQWDGATLLAGEIELESDD